MHGFQIGSFELEIVCLCLCVFISIYLSFNVCACENQRLISCHDAAAIHSKAHIQIRMCVCVCAATMCN